MSLSKPALFLFLLFTFNVMMHVVQGRVVINKDTVASGSSATRRAGCEKQRSECKEGNVGSEETQFENEDYVYTNSLP
ncbi:hypothetical protein RIF29_42366 [Crotalaria pallida]|uniref:Uncharacterized protein n=1 Tax=Crotalaria pallida TaxID=3830 RepID=A0AAN9E6T9_CROPI